MFRQGAKFILLLIWLFPRTQALCQTNQQDSSALVDLYVNTNGANWNDHTGWLTGNVDTWAGVILTGNRVSYIDLSGNLLSGVLPSSLGNLDALTDLRLYNNSLSGTIPVQLGNLSSLQFLSLSNNNLTGALPASLGNLTNVQIVDLSGNHLSGALPTTFATLTALQSLDLTNNAITGTLPLSLLSLSNLNTLALGFNQISDSLRNSIYGLQNLITLDLSNNQLKGSLPDSLFSLIHLQYLLLNNNQLTGELSKRVQYLTDLRKLDLSFNRFACRIPLELNQCVQMSNLNLSNNQFDDMDPLPYFFGAEGPMVDVSHNRLQFGDLEANQAINSLNYAPQDSLFWQITDHLTTNSVFYEDSPVEGSDNVYIWNKDGIPLSDNGTDIYRPNVIASDAGRYILEIHSNVITDLVLFRKAIILTVSPCLSKVDAQDSLALVAIYDSMGGPNWTNHNGWLTAPLSGTPPDTWQGVTTSACGHVINLGLANDGLKGAVPVQITDLTYLQSLDLSSNSNVTSVPDLGKLTNLQVLELSNDDLSGTFPAWVTKLTSLTYLNLGNNHLTGQIPDAMSDLGELVTWYSGTNQLNGIIPPSICQMTKLGVINLEFNNLTGTIPSGVGELINLTELSLDNNKFSGLIPSEINNLDLLNYLSLNSNQLSGTIPDFSNLTNLLIFDLNSNMLTGIFPPYITSLPSLKGVNFSVNQLTGTLPSNLSISTNPNLTDFNVADNLFTGVIPSSIGTMDRLKSLDLRYNKLNGPIPPELGNLDSLTYLGLTYNSLGLDASLNEPGVYGIPPELGNLHMLVGFWLDQNSLAGPIPVALGNLPNVTDFRLNQNQLTGPIPPEIGNDTSISWMDLSNNQLDGPIPKEFGNLSNLSIMFLNDNHYLTGPLPPELGNCTKMGDFVVGGNKLTGPIPSTYSSFTKLFWLDLSDNLFTDSIPSFLSQNTGLNYFFIANNKFTYVPDFTSVMPQLIAVSLSNNKFTFESLEPYYKVKSRWTVAFDYSPQDSIGIKKSASQMTDCPFNIPANVGGSANNYQWYKNGSLLAGKTNAALTLPQLAAGDAGNYNCAVTSSIVAGLTLNTQPFTISVNPRIDAFLNEDLTNAQCNVRTLIATPGTLFTYQWYLDGDKMVGATNDTLVAYYDGAYTVVYQPDPTTCKLTSPALSVAGLYSDGQPVVTGSGSPVTNLSTSYVAPSYQWYVNDKVIANATTDSLEIWYNGSYYLVVNLPNNCHYRSNTVTISENKYPDLARIAGDTVLIQPPDQSVFIYPNPVVSRITVETGSFPVSRIEFYDNTNKALYKKEFDRPADEFQIDISAWAPGIYLISITSDEKRIWRKLVKY